MELEYPPWELVVVVHSVVLLDGTYGDVVGLFDVVDEDGTYGIELVVELW